jgi:Protein of unknown function (DUF416)
MWFAYVAERLMPLYVAFVRKHEWGDAKRLQQELDGVWDALSHRTTGPNADVLSRLESMIPSGERFDSPDSTYAQDVIICVDAAVRALLDGEALVGEWAEFAVEPTYTMVSKRLTGYLAVEGDARGLWEARLLEDAEVASFLGDLDALTDLLASGATIDPKRLRQRAISKRLPPSLYFGTDA